MGLDELKAKHSTDSEFSSKVLIIAILSAIVLCFIAVVIWLNAITKKKGKAVQALTKAPVVKEAEITPVVSIEQTDLSISKAQISAATQVKTAGIQVNNSEESVNKVRVSDIVTFETHTVAKDESIAQIAQQYGLRNQTLIQINALKTVYPPEGTELLIPSIDGQVYTVAEGDNFFTIAKRFSLTISWNTLKAVNGISDEDFKPGLKMFIPYSNVSFGESHSLQQYDSFENFVLPLKDCNISVNFAGSVADPLTGKNVELDGVLIQTLSASDVACVSTGTIVDRGFNTNGTSFIKLSHDEGYTTYYDYLTWVNVEVGQTVSKGEIIGTISEGNTKLNTPTLFLRIEQDGIALDPTYFF